MTPSIDGELLDRLEALLREHPESDPITSAEIAAALDIDDDAGTRQKTREAIRILVDENRIAVAGGPQGYYHVEHSDQLEAEVESLQSRAQSIIQRAQNLTAAYNHEHSTYLDNRGEEA